MKKHSDYIQLIFKLVNPPFSRVSAVVTMPVIAILLITYPSEKKQLYLRVWPIHGIRNTVHPSVKE